MPDKGVPERKGQRRPFHDRNGQELANCNVFAGKTLDEKTEWVKTASLSFHCLTANHRASECQADIKCSHCGSDRHLAVLHKEEGERHGEELQSR